MKLRSTLLLFAFTTCFIYGRVIDTFESWDKLIRNSEAIIVVRCGKPQAPYPCINCPRSDSSVTTLYSLKGTNEASRLWTDRGLHEGENYLVFGYVNNGTLVAYEDFKVVPLGTQFSTNWIAGKNLDEQIQVLFKHALFQLDREIKEDQQQKAQLETAVGKQ